MSWFRFWSKIPAILYFVDLFNLSLFNWEEEPSLLWLLSDIIETIKPKKHKARFVTKSCRNWKVDLAWRKWLVFTSCFVNARRKHFNITFFKLFWYFQLWFLWLKRWMTYFVYLIIDLDNILLGWRVLKIQN